MKHVLALVCLLVTFFCQSQSRPQTSPLRIGNTLPKNLLIEEKQLTKDKLAGKYILLSFWTPTCGSCFHQLEQLNGLQQRFLEKLVVIPVTQSSEGLVKQVYSKVTYKLPDLPMRYSDSLLSALLPHRSVPHHVWLDKEGVIRYITDNYAISEENLAAFVNQRTMNLPEKRDLMDYDASVPLYQEGGGRFLPRLTRYTYFMDELEGLPFGGLKWVKDSAQQVRGLRIVNASLSYYISMLIAKGNFRELIKDRPVQFAIKPADSTYLKRKYCYESWGLPGDKSQLYSKLQKDLEEAFPFSWNLERQALKHYKLVRARQPITNEKTTGNKKKKVLFKGSTERFLEHLKAGVKEEGIFEDRSGYSGELNLPLATFDCLATVKAALQKQGLDLQVTTIEKEVIVVNSK